MVVTMVEMKKKQKKSQTLSPLLNALDHSKAAQCAMVATKHVTSNSVELPRFSKIERSYFKNAQRVGYFGILSLFLTYNQIGVSYGHDFFTHSKIHVK